MHYPSDNKFYKTCIPKNVASFTSDMKKNYKSPSYGAALKSLDSFEKSWGEKYPYAIKPWKNNFDEFKLGHQNGTLQKKGVFFNE